MTITGIDVEWPPALERFWSKVQPTGFCWEWTGRLHPEGYGATYAPSQDGSSGRTMMAHRRAYELLVGEIPPGFVLDHQCENRRCVNPDHLVPCARVANAQRSPKATARTPQKSSCLRGHPLSGDNLGVQAKTGYRYCRECRRAKKRDSYRARKEGARR